MPFPARLVSLATAVPPFVFRQEEVRAEAQILFRERGGQIARMLPVYDNAGVESRYSCVPLDWYRSTGGWKNRNALFVKHAVELLRRAGELSPDATARLRGLRDDPDVGPYARQLVGN